jgi:general secretion pathway protein L
MREALLLFLSRDGGIEGWIRIAEGVVAARGAALDGIDGHRSAPVVAVAPGEAATLRWLELPAGLSPAQAAGAARLTVAELSAQPVTELHVAVGRDSGDGRRCVGLVPVETMRGWLDGLEGAGFDAERIIPETLLVPAPAEGLSTWDRRGWPTLWTGRRSTCARDRSAGGATGGSLRPGRAGSPC